MKIGVFTVLFSQRPFEEALDYVNAAGCEAVEIGVGGFPGAGHANAAALLEDDAARKRLRTRSPPAGWRSAPSPATATRSIPGGNLAEADDRDYRNAVQLAQKLGVPTVITFSGCPGGGPEAMEPNWVTCPWPPNFTESLEWQWKERATPYWSEAASYARDRGVRVAIELHPGFLAYHTDSFHRLREIGGETLGVNFDPSHLFWQGMDPLVCVRALGDAIFHVHAKDTWLDAAEYRHQWRPRHQAVHRRDSPLVVLPHGWLRAWPGVLALPDERAAAGRLRRRHLHRARRLPDERQRGVHQRRRVPQRRRHPGARRPGVVDVGTESEKSVSR